MRLLNHRKQNQTFAKRRQTLSRVALAFVMVVGAVAPAAANYLNPSLASAATAFNASNVLGQLDANGNPTYITNTAKTFGNEAPTASTLADPNAQVYDAVHHRLFVTDSTNSRVLVYNTDTTTITNGMSASYELGQANFNETWCNRNDVPTAGTLCYAQELVYQASTNRLFVADTGNSRVMVYDLSAGITNGMNASYELGQANFNGLSINRGSSAAANTLNRVAGLAYSDSTKTLFVADRDNSRILTFDLSNGITNGMNANHVIGQSNFSSRYCNPTGSPTANSLCFMEGLGFNSTTNTLFAADRNNNRVLGYDLSTGISDGMSASYVIGQNDFTSQDVNQGATTPGANTLWSAGTVAVDTTNDLLIIGDQPNNRVLIYSIANGITNGMSANYVLGQPDFTSSAVNRGDTATASTENGPTGLLASDGRLLVADQGNNRVLVYDLTNLSNGAAATNVLGQTDFSNNLANGRTIPSATGLASPTSTAIDTVNHRIYVADQTNNRVLVYNLDSNNNLVDYTADFVLGQYNFSSAQRGKGINGQTFRGATGLAIDTANNRLFVADKGNNRVLVFNTANLTTYMSASFVLGQTDFGSAWATQTVTGLNGPNDVTYDATHNRLYVADSNNNRVVAYDTAALANGAAATAVLGQANFTDNSAGTGATRMAQPKSVSYDITNDRLVVADSDNNRVLVFDVSSLSNDEAAVYVLGQSDFNSNAAATTQGGLNNPKSVTVDASHSRLFVADSGNNRVLSYDTAVMTNGQNAVGVIGQIDFTSNTSSAVSQSSVALNNASGSMAYDSTTQRLWVADNGNNRVVSYDFITITSGAMPSGTVGAAYSQTVTSKNSQGTPTISVTGGTLPTGLTFNSSTATLSGTPTAAGTYVFDITASDDNGSAGAFTDTTHYTVVIASNVTNPDASANTNPSPKSGSNPHHEKDCTHKNNSWQCNN